MDQVLIHLNSCQERPDRSVQIDYAKNFPLVMSRDAAEFQSYIRLLIDRGFVDGPTRGLETGAHLRLTSDGWGRLEQIELSLKDSNQAFVAMWFDPGLDESWDKGFKPARWDSPGELKTKLAYRIAAVIPGRQFEP